MSYRKHFLHAAIAFVALSAMQVFSNASFGQPVRTAIAPSVTNSPRLQSVYSTAPSPSQPDVNELSKTAKQKIDFHNRLTVLMSNLKNTKEDAYREAIASEIKQLSTEEFQAYQKQRDAELKTLEEKIRKLRELHDRRGKEKEEIISERVRTLLRA